MLFSNIKETNQQPFSTKHQPEHIDNFIGNGKALTRLQAMLDSENRHHGYIFAGPYGIGKSALAYALSRYVGADKGWDTVIVDIATCKDLKRMRKMFDKFNLMPHGEARLFIFDEAQNITPSAQNEFLRYLDNPSRRTYYVFCTALPDKLIEPLRDRCFRVNLEPLRFKERMRLLRRICKKERIELDRQVLKEISKQSEGIPRKLVNLLFEEITILRSQGKDKSGKVKAQLRSC
jgi:DNA polymerase III subunit gamma/tau